MQVPAYSYEALTVLANSRFADGFEFLFIKVNVELSL
jgi:hypothetical protein